MKKIYSSTIYEPEEDSYLMQEQVKKYAFGNVLDMGCGSGILGITAMKKNSVTKITFADINPDALSYVKRKLLEDKSEDNDISTEDNNISNISKAKLDKCNFIHTNLYSKIGKEKFDVIIFNPPYLPDDKYDNEKLITTGGEKGYEIIESFLKDSKKHLNNEGIILLLFSSLTGKKKIDEMLKELKYSKETIAKKGLFMEQLFVYKIKSISENMLFYGHRGVVSIENIIYKGKNIKAAVKTPLSKTYDYNDEVRFLKILNKESIGPKLFKVNKKNQSIMMEYIEGKRILNFFEDTKTEKNNIKNVIEKILKQLFIMESLGINKKELINPYKHIIIRDEEPVMIDFERCQYTDRPKNVTQFIQFLCSGTVNHIFKEKGIVVDIRALRDIAKNYKIQNSIQKDNQIIHYIVNCIN